MSGKLDIIVIGATGYTGTILCKYLHSLKEGAGKWGIAGRSKAKLEKLKEELKLDVPSFVVDITKPSTLDYVCGETVCVISCAGPFTNVGMPIVEACVRNETHYVDSTGEYNFVRQVVERYHTECVTKGIVLVPCCGFDCVPSDLGNYIIHKEAGEPLRTVEAFFTLTSAGISSGTANSIAAVLENMNPADKSPTSLVTQGGVKPRAAPTRLGLWYDTSRQRFSGPFVMAAGNERIVRRSNSLMGSTASYVEAMEDSLPRVMAVTGAFYLGMLLLSIPPLRRYLLSTFYKPDSSTGPLDEHKKNGSFTCEFVGTTVSGKKITTTLSSKLEAYDATGVFLGECARAVVQLNKLRKIKPGVLTPAVAFGDELRKRCTASGMDIRTISGNHSQKEK